MTEQEKIEQLQAMANASEDSLKNSWQKKS